MVVTYLTLNDRLSPDGAYHGYGFRGSGTFHVLAKIADFRGEARHLRLESIDAGGERDVFGRPRW